MGEVSWARVRGYSGLGVAGVALLARGVNQWGGTQGCWACMEA
jgi:hypothetical protein